MHIFSNTLHTSDQLLKISYQNYYHFDPEFGTDRVSVAARESDLMLRSMMES